MAHSKEHIAKSGLRNANESLHACAMRYALFAIGS